MAPKGESRIVAKSEDLNGEVVIKTRDGSTILQAHIKKPGGGWARITTGTDDPKAALAIGEYHHKKIRNELKRGIESHQMPPKTSFRTVATQVNRDMQMMLNKKKGKPSFRDYITYNRKYHIPYFDSILIDKIGPKLIAGLNDFRNDVWSKEPKNAGKELSQSSINSMNAALNMVFNHAVRMEYMEQWQVPKLERAGREQEKGASFTIEEVEHLLEFLEKWIYKTRTQRSKELRFILRDVIYLLIETGMRPGEHELLDMRWNQLSIWTDENTGIDYIEFYIPEQSKTGERDVIAEFSAVAPALKRQAKNFLI